MVRADLISKGSTVCTPVMVFNKIGHVHAYTNRLIFEVSPIPKNKMNSGINANAVVFRNNSNNGFKVSATSLYQPMMRPKGIAIARAKMKPIIERFILAKKWMPN